MGTRRKIPPLDELSDDVGRFLGDMQKETDRGAALVTVAFLEDALGALLSARFIADDQAVSSVLNRQWSIETRADLAYCLGLIRPELREDIKIITDIRNSFGHGHRPVSFNDTRVSEGVAKLRGSGAVLQGTWRYRFIVTAMDLASDIIREAKALDAARGGT
jgi:hypothetical protein